MANHDTERVSGYILPFSLCLSKSVVQNGASLNYTSPNNMYTNALVLSLAHSYGTPTVLSSYKYNLATDGAPDNGKPSLLAAATDYAAYRLAL